MVPKSVCELFTLNSSNHSYNTDICLLVWRDRVRRLATDPVVMRSIPATGHIRCALLANQPK